MTAAFIWIFIKLPQEWWIHIAQLDFTEFVADHSWAAPLLVVLFAVAALVFWFVIRPRLRPTDHPWQFAADPLPEEMDTAAERSTWHATYGALRSTATVEKIVLLGLISVIYAQTLPGVHASNTRAVHRCRGHRRGQRRGDPVRRAAGGHVESALALFGARLLFNIGFVALAEWLLGRRRRPRHGRHLLLPDADQPDHDAPRPVPAGARDPPGDLAAEAASSAA